MTVPWVPSPRTVVNFLMEMLNVRHGDRFVDLGCGDGRVVIEAAKRGAMAVCIEIDRVLCNVASVWADLMGVRNRFKVICRDFFDVDLREIGPDIVYAYLYPSTLESLASKLENELSPGSVVVTLDFAIRGWSPIYVKTFIDENGHRRVLWIYVVGLSNPKARVVGLADKLREFASKLRNRFVVNS